MPIKQIKIPQFWYVVIIIIWIRKHFDFVAKLIALVAKSLSYLGNLFFFLIYEVLNI